MVVLLQNSNCHARPGSDAKPHCATLGQDLMLFLLKNYKTALCHAWPGSDGGPVEELQNYIYHARPGSDGGSVEEP